MRRSDTRTTEALSENLIVLLEQGDLSYAGLAKRTKPRVSPKTIGNMVNGVGAPRLDKVEAIARAFDLECWQLLIPGLVTEKSQAEGIKRLFVSYCGASEDGRRHVEAVAVRESELEATAARHRGGTKTNGTGVHA